MKKPKRDERHPLKERKLNKEVEKQIRKNMSKKKWMPVVEIAQGLDLKMTREYIAELMRNNHAETRRDPHSGISRFRLVKKEVIIGI